MAQPTRATIRLNNPLSVDQYMSQWRATNSLPLKGLDKIERRYRFYSKYNLERQERVESEWLPSPTFMKEVDGIVGPLTFFFVTDDWCIDSAYSLPLLQWISSRKKDIQLIIGLKNDNLQVLDEYLTDGARSIPKLIIENQAGEIVAVWGPQPEEIRLIRKNLMDNQAEGSVVSGTTIEWYANSGVLEVEKELGQLFSSL
ncbi:thioredoxin family protein [bacterium]|nr:thioredoxin family protein [bacterium]